MELPVIMEPAAPAKHEPKKDQKAWLAKHGRLLTADEQDQYIYLVAVEGLGSHQAQAQMRIGTGSVARTRHECPEFEERVKEAHKAQHEKKTEQVEERVIRSLTDGTWQTIITTKRAVKGKDGKPCYDSNGRQLFYVDKVQVRDEPQEHFKAALTFLSRVKPMIYAPRMQIEGQVTTENVLPEDTEALIVERLKALSKTRQRGEMVLN